MKAVTSDEMKKIEREAIFDIGIPSLVLMETAAFKLSERCFEVISEKKRSKVVVFAGKGNNGGDGLAFCRHLHQKRSFDREIEIEVIFVGDKERASEECKAQLNILTNLIERGFSFQIHFLNEEKNFDISKEIADADLIVDAIIGTGLKYELREDISKIVDIINNSGCVIACADCPTGVDADNGNVLGNGVYGDFTVTFHLPKVGLLVGEGAVCAGQLFIEDINIPYGLEKGIMTNVLERKEVYGLIPKRPKNANKGTFGKVFIFAGCENMPGACVIASKAAYRIGAGLVYSCSVRSVCEVVRTYLPEAVTKVLPDKGGSLFEESVSAFDFSNANAVVVGPGLGDDDGVLEFVKKVTSNSKAPVIIDADGLNAISKDLSVFREICAPCIITPHLREMSRLSGKSVSEIKKDIVGAAREFSQEHNVIVVLKDFRTVIAEPNGRVFINMTGCSALSKGGSGDCLTGIIGGLVAQGMDCFFAGVLATYIFGLSGERAEEEFGGFCTLARECADYAGVIIGEFGVAKNL